jgi:5-phospho-D-xylono-1,4-lactonase
VAIGHVQRNADVWYLSQITKLGCYVELDGTNCIKYVPDSSRVMLVKGLNDFRYGKQILLGTDSGKHSYQRAYDFVTGVDFDPDVFGPRLLDGGFDKGYVEDLLMNNAQRLLQFGDGRQQ